MMNFDVFRPCWSGQGHQKPSQVASKCPSSVPWALYGGR